MQHQSACTATLLALPGFDAIALSAVPEILRLANRLAGLSYRWSIRSADGGPVAAACGPLLAVDGRFCAETAGELVIICGGRDVLDARVVDLGTLRAIAESGRTVAGFAAGILPLAKAGLLDGHTVAPFRAHRHVLARHFPALRISSQVYTCDTRRMTCGGGTAAVDLMLGWLTERHGPELAAGVSELLVLERVRAADEPQPGATLTEQLGTRSKPLLAAVRAMQRHMDRPLDRLALAQAAGTTVRQMERLFARHLNISPQRYYRDLRLEHAHRLLGRSGLPLATIARQVGFISASHFSTAYRQRYGVCPQKTQRRQFDNLRPTTPPIRFATAAAV